MSLSVVTSPRARRLSTHQAMLYTARSLSKVKTYLLFSSLRLILGLFVRSLLKVVKR